MRKLHTRSILLLFPLLAGIAGFSCTTGSQEPLSAEDSTDLGSMNIQALASMDNLDELAVRMGTGGTWADNGLRVCKGFFGEDTVCMFTKEEWRVPIVLRALDANGVSDIEVKDTFPAEYSVDEVFTNMGTFTVEPTGGDPSATRVVWNVDDLPYGTAARLVVLLSTRQNPAGIQEFTSPGTYDLNPGVNVHWTYNGQAYEIDGILHLTVDAIECD